LKRRSVAARSLEKKSTRKSKKESKSKKTMSYVKKEEQVRDDFLCADIRDSKNESDLVKMFAARYNRVL
jgi:hypothetical protein